jgi:hypothetical protein
MATFTASEINALKRNHAGINMVRSRIGIASGSLTTSDVVLMVRVPNGATVIDWWVSGGIAIDGGTGTWKLGVQGSHTDGISGNALSDDTLFAALSLTASGIARAGVAMNYSISSTWTASAGGSAEAKSARPGLMPFKISVSDGAIPQWVWLQLTNSEGSTTATCSLQMTVLYIVGQD